MSRVFQIPPKEGPFYYRVEDYRTAPPVDEFDNPYGPSEQNLRVRKFKILKETKKGVWIEIQTGYPRFVNGTTRKQFASPTLEKAYESYIARKRSQLRILSQQAKWAEIGIRLANKALGKPTLF